MQATIYVGNLSYELNSDGLRRAFADFGNITEVKIITERDSGRSKGFGFITFATADEAKQALAADGHELAGRPLRVRLAEQEGSGGGGKRGGFGGGGGNGGRGRPGGSGERRGGGGGGHRNDRGGRHGGGGGNYGGGNRDRGGNSSGGYGDRY